MDDIIRYDVRAYVEKLIEKEFSFKNKEDQILPENPKPDAGEHRKVQPPSVAIAGMGRTASDSGG